MTLVGGIENPGSSATGTVTNTGGALTNNAFVLGAGGNDIKTTPNFVTNGTTTATIGIAGGGNGVVALSGNTSGTATITAPAIAGTIGNPIVSSNSINIANGGTSALPALTFAASANTGLYANTGSQISLSANGTPSFTVSTNLVRVASGGVYGMASTSNDSTGGVDTGMSRFAAGIVAFGGGSAAQKTALIQSGMSVFVTSNFTTSGVGTALEVITGLSITVPAIAANWTFHAHLAYSQAVANAAVAFGIQAATNNPTNIFAQGTQQITVGPPATLVTGTLATLATTTATNIVSGTPGATATNYIVDLYGTCELAATANTIRLLVSTATAADLVTILRGSYLHFNC